jgi:hypothetical protein
MVVIRSTEDIRPLFRKQKKKEIKSREKLTAGEHPLTNCNAKHTRLINPQTSNELPLIDRAGGENKHK